MFFPRSRPSISFDASQMTPVPEFESLYLELTDRLGALNSAVVLANIPDVTSIALLLDGTDLEKRLGSDLGLPPGDFTTVPTMLLIGLGLEDATLIQNPNYVLDATEVETINARVATFNNIIGQAAADIGAPVLDINQLFTALAANPPVLNGTPLTHRFLGGMFSLDGVHPSNIAHALIADQILALLNAAFGANVARLTSQELLETIVQDPFWDKDLDGQAVGRPFTSLLETIAFVLGFTGDSNDMSGSTAFSQRAGSGMRAPLLESMGLDPERPDFATAVSILKRVYNTAAR